MSFANFGPTFNAFSLVDAGTAGDVDLPANAANQVNIVLCRNAANAEITLPLSSGVYSVSITASLLIPAAAGEVGLQNLMVNCTNTANTLLVSSIFAQTSGTATASTVILTGSAVVVIPVATALKLRCNYLNIIGGFAPDFATGSRIDAVRLSA